MNRNHLRSAAGIAMLAAFVLAPGIARADYKCASPSGSVDTRACAMAAAGPDTLRRFVERTRNIYSLYYWDYIRHES